MRAISLLALAALLLAGCGGSGEDAAIPASSAQTTESASADASSSSSSSSNSATSSTSSASSTSTAGSAGGTSLASSSSSSGSSSSAGSSSAGATPSTAVQYVAYFLGYNYASAAIYLASQTSPASPGQCNGTPFTATASNLHFEGGFYPGNVAGYDSSGAILCLTDDGANPSSLQNVVPIPPLPDGSAPGHPTGLDPAGQYVVGDGADAHPYLFNAQTGQVTDLSAALTAAGVIDLDIGAPVGVDSAGEVAGGSGDGTVWLYSQGTVTVLSITHSGGGPDSSIAGGTVILSPVSIDGRGDIGAISANPQLPTQFWLLLRTDPLTSGS